MGETDSQYGNLSAVSRQQRRGRGPPWAPGRACLLSRYLTACRREGGTEPGEGQRPPHEVRVQAVLPGERTSPPSLREPLQPVRKSRARPEGRQDPPGLGLGAWLLKAGPGHGQAAEKAASLCGDSLPVDALWGCQSCRRPSVFLSLPWSRWCQETPPKSVGDLCPRAESAPCPAPRSLRGGGCLPTAPPSCGGRGMAGSQCRGGLGGSPST